MHFATLFVVSALFSSCTAGKALPGNDPELGPYQNDADLFPSKESWYLVHQNFKDDPLFGDNPTCLRWKGEAGPDDESVVISSEFWPDPPMEFDMKLMSSPGYSVNNVMHVQDKSDGKIDFNLTIAYVETDTCLIVRHSYIEEGKGCSYWVPESQLGVSNRCCEFIFCLLCGTLPKYTIYVDGQCPE